MAHEIRSRWQFSEDVWAVVCRRHAREECGLCQEQDQRDAEAQQRVDEHIAQMGRTVQQTKFGVIRRPKVLEAK